MDPSDHLSPLGRKCYATCAVEERASLLQDTDDHNREVRVGRPLKDEVDAVDRASFR